MLDLSEYYLVEEHELPPQPGQQAPVNIVFKGGGSLTISYLGVIEALLDRKIPVHHVMGTSAGAMFGFYLAARTPLTQLKQMLYAEPGPLGAFKDILDYFDPHERSSLFNANIKKIIEKAKGNSHLTNSIHMSVWSLFSMIKGLHWVGADDADIMAEALINGQVCKGDALIDQFKRILKYQGADPYLPFKDFEAYFGIDLQVVTSDLTSHELRLLNAHTSPDLPVAVGVAMSAAFPIMFPAIEWKQEWGRYNKTVDMTGHLMSDGGLVSNFPIRYFVSNEPPILQLRGGQMFNIHKTLFVGAYDDIEPDLTAEEREMVYSIPAAVIPPCETKIFTWNNWSMFHFFSSVIEKIEGSLHSLAEFVGICSHSKQDATPSSWDQVLDDIEDLPGLKIIFNMAITLTSYEEKMYTNYYTSQLTKIPSKYLSSWSINFKENDVKPYLNYAYKVVSDRLNEITK